MPLGIPNFTGDLKKWASELTAYLKTTAPVNDKNNPLPIQLAHRKGGLAERSATEGIVMYDPVTGHAVVSNNGGWQRLTRFDDNEQTGTTVTMNSYGGRVITPALTTAAGATQIITINNNKVDANSRVLTTTRNYGGTTGYPVILQTRVGPGFIAIYVTNVHPSAALNGLITINFAVLN